VNLMPKYTFLAERITVYASLTGERFDSQEKAKRESHIHKILEVMASIEEEILKRSETLSRGMAKKLFHP